MGLELPLKSKMASPEKRGGASCSIFVGNIPQEWSKSNLDEVFGAVGPVKRSIVVQQGGNRRNVGYVHYEEAKHAAEALDQLRGKTIGGVRLVLKPAKDRKAGHDTHTVERIPERRWIPHVNKKARIVVRNLSFKASEETVKDHFSRYGEVLEVSILRKPDGKMVGCCFVQFSSLPSAAQAIKLANAKPLLNRPVAVDWAIPKDQFRQGGKPKEAYVVKVENEEEAGSLNEDGVRVKQEAEESDAEEVTVKEEPESEDEDDEDEEESDEEDDDDESDDDDDESDEEEPSQKPKRDLKSDGGEGKTAFIRNLSFDSTAEDLKKLFGQFGRTGYAVLCINKLTKHSKGTAFVNFEDPESFNKCVEAAKSRAGLTLDGRRLTVMKAISKEPKRELKSDAGEGKTIFIRNLSFDSTEEDLKELFGQFGTTVYAVLSMDTLTEHPKGTAFVKFEDPESVNKCLEAAKSAAGLNLDGRRLVVMKAISREDLKQQKENMSDKTGKDNRNLFLAREGLVRPGTDAAQGVSGFDMTKRLQLERWKRQMLNNLNMFVSKTRLCIHNIPPYYTDKKLRFLFMRFGGEGCKVTEAKIMRDLKKPDANGVGLSKEYGFVSFSEHEHAMRALRSVNNNPSIFTNLKRPIVEFSLENRAAVNVKQKRLEKSQQNNSKLEKDTGEKKGGKERKERKRKRKEISGEVEDTSFMGATSDPKVKSVLSQRKITEMVKANTETQSQLKKNKKITRKMLNAKNQRKRKRTLAQTEEVAEDAPPPKEKKQKRSKKVKKEKELMEDKHFGEMVNRYKRGIEMASAERGGKKWFE